MVSRSFFAFMGNTPVKPIFMVLFLGNGIRPTYFNVVLLVVFPFISDTFLKLLVNCYLFAVCFFACGYVIVLGIFGF